MSNIKKTYLTATHPGIGGPCEAIVLDAKLIGLFYMVAGAATAPLLADHPGYVFPSREVSERVAYVLKEAGIDVTKFEGYRETDREDDKPDVTTVWSETFPNTHRALIETSVPPGMQLIAAGDKRFCETQLEVWMGANRPNGLDEYETALVVKVEKGGSD